MADVSKIGIEGGDVYNIKDAAASTAIEIVNESIQAIQEELDNAKVGRDGVVYDTLGDAVRNQLTIEAGDDNETPVVQSKEIPTLTVLANEDGKLYIQDGDIENVKDASGNIVEQMVYVFLKPPLGDSIDEPIAYLPFDSSKVDSDPFWSADGFRLASFFMDMSVSSQTPHDPYMHEVYGVNFYGSLEAKKLPFAIFKKSLVIVDGNLRQTFMLCPLFNIAPAKYISECMKPLGLYTDGFRNQSDSYVSVQPNEDLDKPSYWIEQGSGFCKYNLGNCFGLASIYGTLLNVVSHHSVTQTLIGYGLDSNNYPRNIVLVRYGDLYSGSDNNNWMNDSIPTVVPENRGWIKVLANTSTGANITSDMLGTELAKKLNPLTISSNITGFTVSDNNGLGQPGLIFDMNGTKYGLYIKPSTKELFVWDYQNSKRIGSVTMT